jgi:hypothetical protein
MKITEEQFKDMKEKYTQEVKIGKAGRGIHGEIDNQTNWVSYKKEDLLKVLDREDVTGIKFYFTEYSQKVAEELYGNDADKYVGRLALVYSPISDTSGTGEASRGTERDEYYDKGTSCPPHCENDES